MKKLFIQTFGCQMNFADSQKFCEEFAKYNFKPTDNLSTADAVLVNTCTVREHAEHRALSYIGYLRPWKKQNQNRILAVTGCAAQRMGGKLQKKFPHIDFVSGSREIDKFPQILKKVMQKKNPNTDYAPTVSEKYPLSSCVTIMRGCSHKCSYCIVPEVRGKAVFRTPDDIIKEIQNLSRNGAKEIFLLGQTVNAYICKNVNFAGLLRLIHKIPEIKRIRYLSPHPIYVNDEFIETLRDCPKIARHIHLPIQSGSDKILKLTGRGYTVKNIISIIEKLKNRLNGFSVSTDLMTGFPDETEKDFNDTLQLVKKCGFLSVYCFKYSPRQGTKLAKIPQNTPQLVIEQRLNKLLNLVKEISLKELLKQTATVQEVMLETGQEGRTSSNWRVKLAPKQNTDKNHRPGDLLKVKIIGSFKYTLQGQVI